MNSSVLIYSVVRKPALYDMGVRYPLQLLIEDPRPLSLLKRYDIQWSVLEQQILTNKSFYPDNIQLFLSKNNV